MVSPSAAGRPVGPSSSGSWRPGVPNSGLTSAPRSWNRCRRNVPFEPEIVRIPEGPVQLGMPAFPADSKLPHAWMAQEVFVPQFRVAKYAVTVSEYLEFAGTTGYPICDAL